MTACSLHVSHCRRVLNELQASNEGPTPVAGDNESALTIAEGEMITSRTRHIPIRYFKVRELISGGEIIATPVRSEDNVSDIFTKSLRAKAKRDTSEQLFDKHWKSLCNT